MNILIWFRKNGIVYWIYYMPLYVMQNMKTQYKNLQMPSRPSGIASQYKRHNDGFNSNLRE